jgi:hypothetical protein
MAIEVNYNKRKNSHIFSKFTTIGNLNLDTVQNYMPIYDRFFSLNSNNFNSINFNHKMFISDIKDNKNKGDDDHIFNCKLQHVLDENYTVNAKVFIKMAPLLDPFKYLVGKYNHTDPNLFSLPTYDKTNGCHVKINNPNNSAYIDGFFSYLTSQLLHQHNFIHGLDYYGSFLAIKNDYKINVVDDIDYLIQSEFFNKQQNVLFSVEDYSHLIFNANENSKIKPINISSSLKSHISVTSINDVMFEDIFEKTEETTQIQEVPLTLDDIKKSNMELIDITNSPNNLFNNLEPTHTETLKSGSSCSSRTSHTNDQSSDIDCDDDDSEISSDESESESVSESETHLENTSIEEETLLLTFPKFPIQVICMEKCDNTFDDLILKDNLSLDEWFSALMQIIMILITYQKMFAFTHNDLHSNNIMYSETNKKYIYYTYKKNTYKVPTFGRLYKIIDFGRAIYKYKGKIFCSDSFQLGGDASTQYNTDPYFNDKKPRLEPNFSFDLCRLACSIFDYVVDDIDDIKIINDCTPLVKLIVAWCIDDNGINVLYKNNGSERYPDFKLYKMIARHVHNHTPHNQLERDEFRKYKINGKNIPKNEVIINIDDYPSYI